MLLQLENATLSYGSKPLFQNANFSVNEGDRIGLVGDNGCGKTSLFRCILGQETLSSGKRLVSRNVSKIGYVPQVLPSELKDQTLYDYLISALPPEEKDYSLWKVDTVLSKLDIPEDLWNRKLAHLSGGWQRFAMISYAYLQEPDVLLLDEPTNYLDLEKIFKLEKWLMDDVSIPYVVVSHDRTFLDKCTKKTIHMRDGKLLQHNVPYTRAREALLNEDIAAYRDRQIEEKEIERLRAAAKRIKIWSAGRNADMDKRAKAIQHTADRLDARKTEVYKEPLRDISFQQQMVRPNTLLSIRNITITTPTGVPLFKIPELNINKGERVALLGMNGTGKSQFLTRLMKALSSPEQDKEKGILLRFNPQVNVGYFEQNMQNLPKNKGLCEYIASIIKSEQEAIKQLVTAGFPYKKQNESISTLSQGEKARLAFLALKLGKHNFFIMDEPTNHVDIQGQEKFEDALIDNAHTCLFVSHDRYMVEHVATRYLQIDNGILKEIPSPQQFYSQILTPLSNRVPATLLKNKQRTY